MKQTTRRKILKLAAALPVSLPVFNLVAGTGIGDFKYRVVKNQAASADMLVLVDTGAGRFCGDGLYLYPDWGNPVVYEVKMRRNKLTFHYPGVDARLWETTADHKDNRFSGAVVGVMTGTTDDPHFRRWLTANSLQVLAVPAMPAS